MDRALDQLAGKLRSAWSSRSATKWTRQNPASGQCSVTAILVQEILGGAILKTRVGPHWHFYNLVDGERIDLTESQFPEPIAYDDWASSREDAFTDTTIERYQALRAAVRLD